MASTGESNPSSANAPPTVQNINIRVPEVHDKKYAIMRFNASMGVDFSKWIHPKMERENNQVQFKSLTEEMPKFGAGSEYGREQREEARKKKYGIISKKYKPEDQPWILQCGGKQGRKFRGVREGGVTENASYYVFTQAADGVFEAFTVQEWYNFQAHQSYKALSYEEAEEEFNSRNRTFNLFNVMVRKRMKKDEDAEDDDEEGEGKKRGKGKKIKDPRFGDELDEMESSEGDSSNADNPDDEDGESRKKKKAKKPTKPKKRKNASDDEAFEDSDDGDGEGRELDYISSESESDSDPEARIKEELKSVAEEDALRKLLSSGEEDEEEEKPNQDNEDKDEEEDEDRPPTEKPAKDDADVKKKKKEKKKNKDKKPRKEDYGSSSDSSGESSSSELEKSKPSPKLKPGSASSSRSATPTKPGLSMPDTTLDTKKKVISEVSVAQAAKKARIEMTPPASSTSPTPSTSANSNEGVNEESVRRYLSRKPMTTTELLQKFKSKRTGLTSEQLVSHIAQILKRINPVKQTIKGKMYLSIKP